jgi:N-acetylmuramoyl-L-alanine amidase
LLVLSQQRNVIFGIALLAVVLGLELYSDFFPLAGRVVILDAGHGGIDHGSSFEGYLEKDLTLLMVQRLKEKLNQSGAKVIMTRDCDMGLAEPILPSRKEQYLAELKARSDVANYSNADIFITFHVDARRTSSHDNITIRYPADSSAALKLARSINHCIRSSFPIPSKAEVGDEYLLETNTIPTVLINLGGYFEGTNAAVFESPRFQERLVDAVSKGVCLFFSNPLYP